MTAPHIGLIEDDPVLGESLADRLELEGYRVSLMTTAEQALERLQSTEHHLIISDIRLPDMDGEALFRRLRNLHPALPPVIFITGYGSIDQAVRLLKEGAADFLTKPLDLPRLLDTISRLASRPAAPPETGDADISPGMRTFEPLLQRLLSRRETPVLVLGESGVGKEVLAHRLHELANPEAPFVAINCAALPRDLAASELFGHEQGAFTGARNRHPGAFERAGDGTLFLDEIGDMPLDLQTQLLRVVQEREFVRVGGTRAHPVAARLVCATHQDLEKAVVDGTFREDLYYRLNVMQINIPPLNARPADIVWLAERFRAEFTGASAPHTPLSEATRQALLAHDWPGNVRELKNTIERACILHGAANPTPDQLDLPQMAASAKSSLRSAREDAEHERIRAALAANNGQMTATAAVLGISRKGLWQKMKRLGIQREDFVTG